MRGEHIYEIGACQCLVKLQVDKYYMLRDRDTLDELFPSQETAAF